LRSKGARGRAELGSVSGMQVLSSTNQRNSDLKCP
jgi:hypothetical protein